MSCENNGSCSVETKVKMLIDVCLNRMAESVAAFILVTSPSFHDFRSWVGDLRGT